MFNNSSEYGKSAIRKAFQYKSTIKPVIICVLYSLKHFNFTKRYNFTTLPRYCFDSPGRNFRIFLRSSSFDLPFRKDVFSFQRREIGVLNIQVSSARHHFLFIVVREKAVLFFSTRWKDNCRDYFNLLDVVASCSLCT